MSKINLQTISYALIAVTALFLSFRNIYGEDIGFHLHAARWMLGNFSFPDKDTFTYTANENKYIDLNWLYQLLMYGIYTIGENTGLILINSLFILGSVLLLFKRTSSNTSVFLPWIILIGIIAISTSFEVRPHSLSWLFLSIVFYLLKQYQDGNEKIIRWLPVIMLLWTNCHSLFILGLVVTGCYGISIYLRDKHLFKKFLFWSALAVITCFINPYGWHGFALPFEQLFALQEGNVFKENIRELQSPFSVSQYAFTFKNIFNAWHFFDVFVIVSAISFIIGFRRHKIHDWLITAIFFYFAYSAIKNVGYFVFALLPIVANGFSGRDKIIPKNTNKQERISFSLKYKKHFTIFFLLLSALLILSVRTNAFYIHYRATYRFGFGWSNANLPVKATEFMVKNNLHGKILNQLDFGGYLEFFTNQKVSIDGRLDVMREKIFNEQVNAVNDETKQKLIATHNPEIIIFSYSVTPDWITFLQKQSDWRLVYMDECAAIYLQNDFYSVLPALTEEMVMASISQFSEEQMDKMIKQGKKSFILSPLFQAQYYPEGDFNKLAFCFYYGWFDAAKQITLHGFEKSSDDYPELYQNLGSAFFQLRDKDRSLYCYEQYLRTNKNEQVAERVKFLKSL